MDQSFGKNELDPNLEMKRRIQRSYAELDTLKCIYVWGDPGSGKSFLVDLIY